MSNNIKADDIRKAALELIGEVVQAKYEYTDADAINMKTTIGYIVGVCEMTKKITEGEANV